MVVGGKNELTGKEPRGNSSSQGYILVKIKIVHINLCNLLYISYTVLFKSGGQKES